MENSVTKTFLQHNTGTPDQVFPLLCPVREKDWLDGWVYEMKHSVSGLIEKDCVFTTPHDGDQDTVWIVTEYDKENKRIDFVRFTPNEQVVKINISLELMGDKMTRTRISYRYFSLSDRSADYFANKLEDEFNENMQWWEHAINHYIKTGKKLLRHN